MRRGECQLWPGRSGEVSKKRAVFDKSLLQKPQLLKAQSATSAAMVKKPVAHAQVSCLLLWRTRF